MNVVTPSGDLNVLTNSDTDIFGGEAGIVKALSTLRQAAILPKEKAALRDLFLSYAGESDEKKRLDIRDQIIEQITKHPQLASLASGLESVRASSNTSDLLGQTRPTPSFSFTQKQKGQSVEQNVPEPTTSGPEIIKNVVPVRVLSTPEPQKITESVAPTIKHESNPVATPEPTEPIPIAPISAPNADAIRARIDTIKHDINGRVGNPVNIINADETIGREYMSALLSTMKLASTGGGAESLPRLESAYKAALALIEQKGLGKNTGKIAETTVHEVEVATTKVEIPPKTEPASIPKPTPLPEAVMEASSPTTPDITVVPEQNEGLYHRPADETEAEAVFKPESLASRLFMSKSPTKNEDVPTTVVENPASNTRKVEVNTPAEPVKASSPTTVARDTSDKLQPLKNTTTTLPAKMAEIKSAASKREEASKKPVTDRKAPEIEAGLRQLLSEWVLFKKSGFLGTGPSGIEHPLYKQLAGIPMAAVVSGRFEGVTPDIKRHLSDYMTGWRYEQGIMHEMGETFEHYLRRVIRQILERQRTQATAKS